MPVAGSWNMLSISGVSVPSIPRYGEDMKREAPTILDITLPNLFSHLRPYGRVNLLVLVDTFGLELDDLGVPSAGVGGARWGPELGHCNVGGAGGTRGRLVK